MLLGLFGDQNNIEILPNYKFMSPFIKYLPPIFSPFSWSLRSGVLRDIAEDRFISYTGDKAERIALRFYNLHPIKAKRLEISSSDVKGLLYQEALKKLDKENFTTNLKMTLIEMLEVKFLNPWQDHGKIWYQKMLQT